MRFELGVVKDQRSLLGAAGGVERFEHGEGVVAGGDFLDQAGGEGGGGVIDNHGSRLAIDKPCNRRDWCRSLRENWAKCNRRKVVGMIFPLLKRVY